MARFPTQDVDDGRSLPIGFHFFLPSNILRDLKLPFSPRLHHHPSLKLGRFPATTLSFLGLSETNCRHALRRARRRCDPRVAGVYRSRETAAVDALHDRRRLPARDAGHAPTNGSERRANLPPAGQTAETRKANGAVKPSGSQQDDATRAGKPYPKASRRSVGGACSSTDSSLLRRRNGRRASSSRARAIL